MHYLNAGYLRLILIHPDRLYAKTSGAPYAGSVWRFQ